jgi:hypothetical protein
MGESAARPSSGGVRLLAVIGLLLAVFAMHGGPAAATGCHGAMDAMAVVHGSAVAPMHPAHTSTGTEAMPGARTMTGPSRAVGNAGPGGVCVSTPARTTALPHLPTAAVGLTPATVGAAVRTGPRRSGGTRRRGPPGSGRALLLRVGIARV